MCILRKIRLGDEVLDEQALLDRASVIVVLAEPGAGKTDFLAHLSELLGTERIRASRFRTTSYAPASGPLVIDAMDEVARIGESELHDIVSKAAAHHTTKTIFASRSSEWEDQRTKFVEECFRIKPTIVRLEPFDIDEQRMLFEHEFSGESFEAFSNEAEKFDLMPLLGNPEFLKLFGNAYLENNRKFSSKAQIYADAAKRLAHDDGQPSRGRPDRDLIVKQSASVFARLMLSGASGISRKQKLDERDYPYSDVVDAEVTVGIDHLLDSKLFKPAADANEHEPVHRIVAEYLAAEYLIGRICNVGDTLSLKRCLSVIAPNGTVRDELRGMLGWMAALGDDKVQKAAIKIDSYAVLSNGDPVQLRRPNKLRLIERLQEVAKTDPYFRRGDMWRSFNVGQFFSDDTVSALRPLLASRESSHLRDLVLELIKGTDVVGRLQPELEAMVTDGSAANHERRSAYRLLLDLAGYDAFSLVDALRVEGSTTSLQLITMLIRQKGRGPISFDDMALILKQLVAFYPDRKAGERRRHPDGMSRYFLKEFFKTFPLGGVEDHLDRITSDISCTCGASNPYACGCREGISKIAGMLLDRYFDAQPSSPDPKRVWGWLKNLRFPRSSTSTENASVQALYENHALRQAIQTIALSEAKTKEEIDEVTFHIFFHKGHSGLQLNEADYLAAIERAFQEERVLLWEKLSRPHNAYRDDPKVDPFRSLMRKQAREQPAFLAVWCKNEHAAQAQLRKDRSLLSMRKKRYAQREAAAIARNAASLDANREKIEAGQHWGWLQQFAQTYLYHPENFPKVVYETETAMKALRNCWPFVEPHTPTLEQLSLREWTNVAMVLYAACALRWKETGNLDGIPLLALQAVKTDSSALKGFPDEEWEPFERELDRLLFPDDFAIEEFARRYIEPSLGQKDDAATRAEVLTYQKPFTTLQKKLPLEWLQRFPEMPVEAEMSLFKMAANHTPPAAMKAFIADRVLRYKAELPADATQAATNRRKFWLMNAFFHDDGESIWDIIKNDKDNLLSIAARGRRYSDDGNAVSPPLSAGKLYKILDVFSASWPRVELPDSWGTSDPPEETAYRYISDIPYRLGQCAPDEAIPVLDRLLADPRFKEYRIILLASRALASRKFALHGFKAPSPAEISALLEKKSVASVEDMRALMVEEIESLEQRIRFAATDTLETFYSGGKRVDENTARNRIVEGLNGSMTAQGLSATIEYHMVDSNRSDIAAADVIGGVRRLLPVEVKGQWHSELFTAASAQLDERYASNPDAEKQGIYLVLWFGEKEKVAGVKNTKFKTPQDLKAAIIETMPEELWSRIDVCVIDLSRRSEAVAAAQPKKRRATSQNKQPNTAAKAKAARAPFISAGDMPAGADLRTSAIGILAYGSLINDPGAELKSVISDRIVPDVVTPFPVEFARSSGSRKGAPTLVPVPTGATVKAEILVLQEQVALQEAKDRLWRRETRNEIGVYLEPARPTPNSVLIKEIKDFHGVTTVLYPSIDANIDDLSAERLADLAIASAKAVASGQLKAGRDGITYLRDATDAGIRTKLAADYACSLLAKTGCANLDEAIEKLTTPKALNQSA